MPDPDWSKPWTVAEFDQSRENCGLGTELLLPKAPYFSVPETSSSRLFGAILGPEEGSFNDHPHWV